MLNSGEVGKSLKYIQAFLFDLLFNAKQTLSEKLMPTSQDRHKSIYMPILMDLKGGTK